MLAVVLSMFTLGLLLSLTTAAWAYRGRRIDDHPLCRRCGFDLTGKPDGSSRCGECGADLLPPKAIKRGHRQTRRAILWIALTLLLLQLGGGVAGGIWWGRGRDLNPYKPVWLLARDLGAADGKVRAKALGELTNRLDGKTAPAPIVALQAAADRLLEKHARLITNPSAPWMVEEADLVELLQTRGVLGNAQFARYIKEGVVVTVFVSPSLREDENLSAASEVSMRGGMRLPAGVNSTFEAVMRWPGGSWRDVPVSMGGYSRRIDTGRIHQLSDPYDMRLKPGFHPLDVRVQGVLFLGPNYIPAASMGTELATFDGQQTVKVEVLPKVVRPNQAPPGLESSLSLAIITAGRPDQAMLRGLLDFSPMPRPLRLRMKVLADANAWDAGILALKKGRSGQLLWKAAYAAALPEKVTIELREVETSDTGLETTPPNALLFRFDNVATGARPPPEFSITPNR